MSDKIHKIYRVILVIIFLAFLMVWKSYKTETPSPVLAGKVLRSTQVLMGTQFLVSIWTPAEKEAANVKILNETFDLLKNLENKISSWKSNSETSLINKNAGIKGVLVSPELSELIVISINWAKQTHGVFDITGGPLFQLWEKARKQNKIPTSLEIKARLNLVGVQYIEQQNNRIYLTKAGMKLGFGAIGKGFSADYAARFLRSKGIHHFIIDAGGDVVIEGSRGGIPWNIGIRHPRESHLLATFQQTDYAIATSGDYERYFVVDGVRYSHILDVRTGWPVHSVTSATVFAKKGADADALATALSVMGVENGKAFIEKRANVEALLVDKKGKLWLTKGLELNGKILQIKTEKNNAKK